MSVTDSATAADRAADMNAKRIYRKTARYLRDAIDLRNSIFLNEQDYRFAHENRGEIRYLLDANIIRFYLNPFKEYKKTAPFGQSDDDTLQAVATVTAEFLLSRQLCGQWGASPMISQWHAREIERHVHKLSVQVRQVLEDSEVDAGSSNLENQIASFIVDAKSIGNRHDLMDRIGKPLGGLGELMADEHFEARQFAEMISDNLINPLHIDRFATSEVIHEPSDADVAPLANCIRTHKSYLPREKVSHSSIKNDARTLLQLERINSIAARDANHALRYVLITTDRALFNAALEWFSSRRENRLDFFPVRRITQYIPILNTQEMPNNIGANALFPDIREALDAFLAAAGHRPNQYPRPIPADWSRDSAPAIYTPFREQLSTLANRMVKTATKDPLYLGSLAHLTRLWGRLSRESVVLNASLLGRRINAFTSLAEFLEAADDVRGAIVQFMDDTVRRVERAHLELSIQHNFAAVVQSLRASGGVPANRRGIAVLETDFEEFVDNQPLLPFLDQMVKDPDRIPLEKLLDRLDTSQIHRALFFSGAVAFWASKWASALQLTERAIARSPTQAADEPPSPEQADLEYFAAVIRRYQAMDEDLTPRDRIQAFNETLAPLDEQLSKAIEHRNHFGRCRLELEIGVVKISISYAHQIDPAAGDIAEARTLALQALRHFLEGLFRLGDAVKGLNRDVAAQLKMQILNGLTGCFIYRELFDDAIEVGDQNSWKPLLLELNKMISEVNDWLPDLYKIAPVILELFIEKDILKRKQIRAEALDKVRSALDPNAPGRTKFDMEVLPLLQQRLQTFSD